MANSIKQVLCILTNNPIKGQTGVSKLLAHLAFYAGWPVAIAAAGVVKQFFDSRTS